MKQYIGSDEHWIDSVNQRYDEQEEYDRQQSREQDRQIEEQIREPITNKLESSYNNQETECFHLLEILQDKVLNLKTSGKNWKNVAELNRVKIQLTEINENF